MTMMLRPSVNRATACRLPSMAHGLCGSLIGSPVWMSKQCQNEPPTASIVRPSASGTTKALMMVGSQPVCSGSPISSPISSPVPTSMRRTTPVPVSLHSTVLPSAQCTIAEVRFHRGGGIAGCAGVGCVDRPAHRLVMASCQHVPPPVPPHTGRQKVDGRRAGPVDGERPVRIALGVRHRAPGHSSRWSKCGDPTPGMVQFDGAEVVGQAVAGHSPDTVRV